MNFLFADTGRILSETVIDTHSVLQAGHGKTTVQMDLSLDFLPKHIPEFGLRRLDLPAQESDRWTIYLILQILGQNTWRVQTEQNNEETRI